MKWIIFPANSVILAAIIAYFNITVFGLRDGLPYSIIVGMIGLFSIVINKYTESDNRSLAKAAFVFEIFLTIALVTNATYSISVQRKMSVAKMAETNQKETITEISKLKGSRTQREALQKIDKQETAQAVFAGVEDILFWIMACELALYGLSAFTLFALAKLMDDSNRIEHRQSTYKSGDEFPDEIETDNTVRRRDQSNLRSDANNATIATQSDAERRSVATQDGLAILRDTLSNVAFTCPGKWFKADVRPDHVLVRLNYRDQGREMTERSAKLKLDVLTDAVRMSRDQFRARLERSLNRAGFQLGED